MQAQESWHRCRNFARLAHLCHCGNVLCWKILDYHRIRDHGLDGDHTLQKSIDFRGNEQWQYE